MSVPPRPVLEAHLPLPRPYDADGVFAWLAGRAVPGCELAELEGGEGLRYARSLRTPEGIAFLDVRAAGGHEGGAEALEVAVYGASESAAAGIVETVARVFDLERDPAEVDAALARDARLAPRIAAVPGMRLPGSFDPAELLVQVLVGQQISVIAARGHAARMASLLGELVSSPIAGLERVFPSPRAIAEAIGEPGDPADPVDPERILRLPRRTTEAIRQAMLDLDAGTLTIGSDAAALRDTLVARPGIGPWTAGYASLRLVGDPDAWPSGDVALLEGARRLGIVDRETPKARALRDLDAAADAWRPWRAYAALHLWRVASGSAGAP